MALPKLEGPITVPTGGLTISVNRGGGTATATIAAGEYFHTTTNGANSPFLTAVGAAITTALAGVTYTLTLDDNSDSSTGKVTLSGTTAIAVQWTSTAIRDALGFSTNLGSATSHVSAYHARYLHLPNVGRARPMAPEPQSVSFDMGAYETDMTHAESPSGESVQIQNNTRRVDTLAFDLLVGYKTWRSVELVTNESMERFWTDVIGAGLKFRYHPDRSNDSIFWTQKCRDGNNYQPAAFRESWHGTYALYSISWRMIKAVGE